MAEMATSTKDERSGESVARSGSSDGSPALINVLNLGAGVQSSTVLLMSICGKLPKLDHVIFADTGWEPEAVYRQMEWLRKESLDADIDFHTCNLGDITGNGFESIKQDALVSQKAGGILGLDAEEKKVAKAAGAPAHPGRWASMPYFTLGPNGEKGQIRRQCTYGYKIRPIERCLRRVVLGLRPRQRAPKEPVIRRWYGISHDEQQRMRVSDEPWCVNWYPLVERHMSRSTCYQWLEEHGFHEPPRSACIGCPYRHNREWREMKKHRPGEWREAVEFDRTIRKCGGMRGDVFIHSDRVPLDEANLWNDCDENQLPLFDMVDECSGMCGV